MASCVLLCADGAWSGQVPLSKLMDQRGNPINLCVCLSVHTFMCVWAPRDGLAPAPGAEVNKVRGKEQLHKEPLHQSPEIHHNGSLQSSYSLQQRKLEPEAGRQKRWHSATPGISLPGESYCACEKDSMFNMMQPVWNDWRLGQKHCSSGICVITSTNLHDINAENCTVIAI